MFVISILGLGYVGYEIANYINYKKVLGYVNMKKNHTNEIDVEKAKYMMNYLLSQNKNELTTWIIKNNRDTELAHISRNNMLKCLCFNIYFVKYKAIDNFMKDELDDLLYAIEDKVNHIFMTNNAPSNIIVDYYKFGYNEIVSTYKPAILYSTLNIIKHNVYLMLWKNGFTKYKTTNNIVYFYREINKDFPTAMFIHGLGFGITPYYSFIMKLADAYNVIIPILPNISNMEINGIFDDITADKLFPNYELIVSNFNEIFTNLNVSNVSIIAHSFGTIILSIILRDTTIFQKVDRKIFIDPVCFIDDCHKIFNYIDKPDDRGSRLIKIFNAVVYNDIYVRYATQRFLYGPKYWVFNYELLSNTIVVLSSKDKIVPSKAIASKLAQFMIPCFVIKGAMHGDIFSDSKYETVIDIMISSISLAKN